MDLKELLSFKPPQDFSKVEEDDEDTNASAGKRKHDDGDDSFEADDGASAKRVKTAVDLPADFVDEGMRIMQQIEDDEEEVEEFGLDELRRKVSAVQRAAKKNQEMRIKHPDDPMKFMDSEVALHTELSRLSVAATMPEHYPALVDMGLISLLTSMLQHENTDLACTAVSLVQELTDVDAVGEAKDAASALINALKEEDFFGQLVAVAKGLDSTEKVEAEGINNAMAVLENVMGLDPEMSIYFATEHGILTWLLGLVSGEDFDDNRLYASEILAIITQHSPQARAKFAELDGIDAILQVLAPYRRSDAGTDGEIEMTQNLFDVLASCLMEDETRQVFRERQGLELMSLLLRSKKMARVGAIKVLDFALSGSGAADFAEVFVEQLGLKALFPMFMKTPKYKAEPLKGSEGETERNLTSIIASLLRELKSEAARERVLGKFVEKDFAKCVRLAELFEQALRPVEAAAEQAQQDVEELRAAGDDVSEEEAEAARFAARLDAGLLNLQTLALIAAEVIVGCGGEMKDEMAKIFRIKGLELDSIKPLLLEYADGVGDEGDKEAEAERVRQLVSRVFGE